MLDVARGLLYGAREGRTAFLTIDCYRFHGHARMDKSPYRDAAEEAAGRQRDPVAHQHARLLAAGLATDTELDAIRDAAAVEMDAALDAAIAAPAPDAAALFEDVYDPSTPPPEPVAAMLDRVFGP